MLSAQTKYLLKQQSNVIIGFYYFIIMSWPHVVELQVTTVFLFAYSLPWGRNKPNALVRFNATNTIVPHWARSWSQFHLPPSEHTWVPRPLIWLSQYFTYTFNYSGE